MSIEGVGIIYLFIEKDKFELHNKTLKNALVLIGRGGVRAVNVLCDI